MESFLVSHNRCQVTFVSILVDFEKKSTSVDRENITYAPYADILDTYVIWDKSQFAGEDILNEYNCNGSLSQLLQ